MPAAPQGLAQDRKTDRHRAARAIGERAKAKTIISKIRGGDLPEFVNVVRDLTRIVAGGSVEDICNSFSACASQNALIPCILAHSPINEFAKLAKVPPVSQVPSQALTVTAGAGPSAGPAFLFGWALVAGRPEPSAAQTSRPGHDDQKLPNTFFPSRVPRKRARQRRLPESRPTVAAVASLLAG